MKPIFCYFDIILLFDGDTYITLHTYIYIRTLECVSNTYYVLLLFANFALFHFLHTNGCIFNVITTTKCYMGYCMSKETNQFSLVCAHNLIRMIDVTFVFFKRSFILHKVIFFLKHS